MAFETERLIVRQWKDSDRAPFAELSEDAEVMKYFPSTLRPADADKSVDRFIAHIEREGFGFWALERKDTAEFIGFVGLNRPGFDLPFNPCVEIGWRLARPHWGLGFATEASRESLRFGFEELALDEIVSMASSGNEASFAVMRRLGMRKDALEFLHPALTEHPSLALCYLYRLAAIDWR